MIEEISVNKKAAKLMLDVVVPGLREVIRLKQSGSDEAYSRFEKIANAIAPTLRKEMENNPTFSKERAPIFRTMVLGLEGMRDMRPYRKKGDIGMIDAGILCAMVSTYRTIHMIDDYSQATCDYAKAITKTKDLPEDEQNSELLKFLEDDAQEALA